MRVLSQKDIEVLSRKVLSKYLRLCDTTPTRIDPADIGARLFDISFEFHRLNTRPFSLGITAMGEYDVTVWTEDGQAEVVKLTPDIAIIDTSLLQEGYEGRRHFTMMHEVAHKALTTFFPEDYRNNIRYCDHPIFYRLASAPHRGPITDWHEWQANVLASCLLLPRELIFKHMKENGLDDRIRLLNKVFAPREYEKFSNMASSLGVSKTALSIRLTQMGLIGRNDFGNPYALVEVFPDSGEVA